MSETLPFKTRVVNDLADAQKAHAASLAFIASEKFASLDPRRQALYKHGTKNMSEKIARLSRALPQID